MNKPSILRRIFQYDLGMIILLCVLLVAYLFTSYDVLSREEKQEAVRLTETYGAEMQTVLNQMERSAREMMLRQLDNMQMLKSPDETTRFYASQDIFLYLRDMMASEQIDGKCVIMADSDFDICLDNETAALNYWDRSALRSHALEMAGSGEAESAWQSGIFNEKMYLFRPYLFDRRAVITYIQARALMDMIPLVDDDLSFFLTDPSGTVIAAKEGNAASGGDQVAGYALREGAFYLSAQMGRRSVWGAVRGNMTAVLLMILVILGFSMLLARYMRRELYGPMHTISEDMEHIKRQEYDLRITDDFGTCEFTQLKDSFNQLMDEIVNLKINRYEQIIALQEMELKSIRLQLRPHFFLNAITTISSLERQNRNGEISAYVDALSKNIRYMFRSGLHTVPVKEEVKHVENYFSMQECVYPGCIFHLIDLPHELAEWAIPQMLIQTIIENEYKYAVSLDEVLTILIRVSMCEYEGETMLKITIEDDGKGYPADVLEAINSPEGRPSPDGNRVGLWSIRRTMELMYERQGLAQFSNITPHGCLNTIFVPRHPLHEYIPQKKETAEGGNAHEDPAG